MKLITSSPKPQALPVIPAEAPVIEPVQVQPAPVQPVTEYKVAFVADKPEPATTIVWAIPLTWKMAGLQRPDIHLPKSVTDWCNYSTAFKNWLYTCLTVFLATSEKEVSIPIPDQFIDDLDRRILTLEKIGESIHVMI